MDNFNILQAIAVIIIPALIAGSPAIIGAIRARHMVKSEKLTADASAAKNISEAYDRMVDGLQQRLEVMEARQNKMEAKLGKQGKRIRYLEHGVFVLINQVRSLGAEPAFNLTDETDEGEDADA